MTIQQKNFDSSKRKVIIWILLFVSILGFENKITANEISFSKQILPLLSNNCFECHGPDKEERKAGLRLDTHDGALMELKSGFNALVPNNSSESELYLRIISEDSEEVMPPPESGKNLTVEEKELIKKWIDSGGEWGKHWAFEKPKKDEVPQTAEEGWKPNNPIDYFIHERLKEEGLTPEKEASKETIIRRLTLDLTGLPPKINDIDKFLNDNSEDAYENLVDRLLKSPRYGENMARIWLDAARYADTHGLHLDNERSIWPYRDWVINSFNNNHSFDEFTIEQIAGDLMPNPSIQQKVATGFNRCNVTTGEGGSIDAEYYVRYATERVETTSTVWLGLTAGCASCHDHKFDPLSQKEFYQLFSYFYSLTEKAMDGNKLLPPPSMKAPSKLQVSEIDFLKEKIKSTQAEIPEITKVVDYEDPNAGQELASFGSSSEKVWIEDSLPPGAKAQGNEGDKSWKFVKKSEEHPVLSGETSSVRTATGLSQHFFEGANPPLTINEGDVLFAHVYLNPENPPETIQLQFKLNDGDWNHRAFWGANKGYSKDNKTDHTNLPMGELPEKGKWVRIEVPAKDVGLSHGSKVNGWAFTQFGGTVHWDKAGITSRMLSNEQLASINFWEQFLRKYPDSGTPKNIVDIIKVDPEKRDENQKNLLLTHYYKNVNPQTKSLYAATLKRESEAKSRLDSIEKSVPSTLIMEDRKEPRQAYVLERGEYTLQKEKVFPGVPEWIAPSIEGAPSNRLGLAKWLVSPEQPLTSRVTVNRFWQQLFGTGLVKTSEDFGVQGEQPSHPELLDWLAINFMETNWDVKRMIKLMVMSSTYRQSSRVDNQKLEKDPENRLLARGPRHRLDAELIRDQALSVSGLLVKDIGGKSVKPYQPAGLWKPVGFGGSNTATFKQDSGSALYRRSMYTFWKRTSHPPSMAIFDAPNRETCTVRRARTNTPLQALVLMNDVQFFEAARKFAEKIMHKGGKELNEKINYAYRTILSRGPTETESKSLLNLYNEHLSEFSKNKETAKEILGSGESIVDESLDQTQLASWTMITHLILNLSETVTKG